MSDRIAPPKVLLADDDDAKRYAVAHALARAGFEVTEVLSGREALERLTTAIDVVVLDGRLPDIDGFELCRRIKTDPKLPTPAVLHLSSGPAGQDERARGLDSGADGYLSFPSEPDDLAATVSAVLRLREAEQMAGRLASQWQATFDAIGDGIALIDRGGRVVQVNSALTDLLETTPDQVVGATFLDVLQRYFGPSPEVVFDPLIHGAQRWAVEVSSGARILHISVDPLSADGGAVCTLSDITDRHRMEAELAAAYEREHRIAESLQRSLLLTAPIRRFAGLEIETFYEAASAEASVGGDFFDCFALPDGRIALVVSDVAGKGLAAAARTAEVKFVLRAYLAEHRSPERALELVNTFLLDQSHDAYDSPMVALALALVDVEAARISLTCAGAEPPLILRASGEPVSFDHHALPLGAFRAASYRSAEYDLAPGDLLLLATDGLTEARRGREFLGYDGVARLAQQHLELIAPKPVGEALLRAARDFAGGKFQDDVCLLIARQAA